MPLFVKKTVFIFFVAFIFAGLTGCNQQPQLAIDDSKETKDSIANFPWLLADNGDTSNAAALGQGQVDQVWKKLFKACMKNDDFSGHAFYFGVSNAQGLGALYSQQGGPVLGHKRLEYLDTAVMSCLQGAVANGPSSSCSQHIEIGLDVNALFTAKWKNPDISGSLDGMFKNAKDIQSTVKHWHINRLAFKQFTDNVYRKKGNDTTQLSAYYNSLPGNYICTSALYADTFQTVFILNDTISAGLKIQIDSGQIVANFGGASGSVNFSRSGRDTIIASSNSTFVVFGWLDKVKPK